jgi:hypothetical protein
MLTSCLSTLGPFVAKALLPVFIAYGLGVSAGAAQAIEETPKEIIAAQIRSQGFSCDNPLSAERDSEYSKPGEDAWILKCENAAYRVRLIPDMAAKVERID